MSLNTCLTQCVDKGLQSLGTSAASFDRISLKSGTIKQMVGHTWCILHETIVSTVTNYGVLST